jgi:DNA-binding MarR family transcriptional regulator
MPPEPSAIRKPPRHFDSPQQEAFLSLWRTYDRLRAFEDELFSQYELTAQQYNALRLLKAEHPGTLPTLVLASRLVSHAPDITRLVDRLEERGLVVRERMPDNRRVVQVGITETGLELLKQLEEPVRACHQRQLGHLGAEQIAALVDLLRSARQPHEPGESAWR